MADEETGISGLLYLSLLTRTIELFSTFSLVALNVLLNAIVRTAG